MRSGRNPINFDHIDYEIREKDLVYYKNSIDQGCIRKANQTGNKKWNYLVKFESNLVELEIIYNTKNIRTFQCGCGAKSPNNLCKHALLASLWHFQKIKLQSDHPANRLRNKAQSFELNKKEDLGYVLAILCQNNPSNKYWVNFILAGRTLSDHPFQKYCNLLSEMNTFLEGSSKNPATRMKYKLDILEELYQLSFYHYNHSNIEEATESLLAGIQFIHGSIDYSMFKNYSKLVSLNDKFHTAFTQFCQLIVAPIALNHIQRLTYACASTPTYLIFNKNSNLFERLLLKKTFQQQFTRETFELLLLKIYNPIPDEFRYSILEFLFQSNPELLSNFLLKHEQSSNYFISLNWLNAKKLNMPTDYLIQYYKSIYKSANTDLKKYIGQLYLNLNSTSTNSPPDDFLLSFYLDTKDAIYLKLYFKENLSKSSFDYAIKYAKLKTGLKTLPHKFVLDLSYHSMQYDVFINELKTTDDLHLLEMYDQDFPEHLSSEYIQVYISFFNKYLNEHAGYQANQKLESSHRRIRNNFSKVDYQEFSNAIKNLFPDRKFIKQIHN